MKLKVYAVYDSKVETFANPFCMLTRGEALRSWEEVVNDPKTLFHRHPADFTLFEIAEYYQDSGRFENHITPMPLGTALEFKKSIVDTSSGSVSNISAPRKELEAPKVV